MLMLVPIALMNSASVGPLLVLGQSYLPNRIGLASGVTLGLAFSFGGTTTPFFGWIADNYGLRTAIVVLSLLPLVCTGLTAFLPKPKTAGA